MNRRLVCFVPSDRPVGGIAKVLDYAVHAARHGVEVAFCTQVAELGHEKSALFRKPYFETYGTAIGLGTAADLQPRADDVVLFSLPSSHFTLGSLYAAAGQPPPTYIHLLQNVRVANTAFDGGYSYRLLPKPMHRICITQEVLDAAAPLVEGDAPLTLIPHGFDFDAFARTPGRLDPVVLTYNTFKGRFAEQVLEAFGARDEIAEVLVSRPGISWPDLQANYHRATVFLATPLPEEGLYLPGLEAMAAGHAVITPDAVGNRFYCDFDDNCALVPFEDIEAYCARLDWLIENWRGAAFEVREKAHRKAAGLGLDSECERFGEVLRGYRDLTAEKKPAPEG